MELHRVYNETMEHVACHYGITEDTTINTTQSNSRSGLAFFLMIIFNDTSFTTCHSRHRRLIEIMTKNKTLPISCEMDGWRMTQFTFYLIILVNVPNASSFPNPVAFSAMPYGVTRRVSITLSVYALHVCTDLADCIWDKLARSVRTWSAECRLFMMQQYFMFCPRCLLDETARRILRKYYSYLDLSIS